jgi:hypothetical protein
MALELPPWLPPAVAEEAAALMQGFGDDSKIGTAIRRLATDERLRPVWNDKRRSVDALRELFFIAATLAGFSLPAKTRAELERDYERTRELTASLRKPAEIASSLWLSESNRAAAGSLAKAADEIERGAQLWRELPFPPVERHRPPAEVRGYLVALADEMKRIFGKSTSVSMMLTIAQVALGKDKDEITREMIRSAFKANGS